MNFLPARVVALGADGVSVSLADGSAPLLIPMSGSDLQIGQSVEIGIRPDHVTLSEDGFLGVEVDTVENLGSGRILYARTRAGVPLTAVLSGTAGPSDLTGRYMRASFFATDTFLFDTDGRRVR